MDMTPSQVKSLLMGPMVFTPPVKPTDVEYQNKHSVFLAGSIEMDKAAPWQDKVIEEVYGNVIFLNPRRASWDASWEQSISNPQFVEQVEWELEGLERANTIMLYFDPNTKSPISMLELGIFSQSGKMMVCCPEGFWRKGNVDIVCKRYNIPTFNSLDELIEGFKRRLAGYN